MNLPFFNMLLGLVYRHKSGCNAEQLAHSTTLIGRKEIQDPEPVLYFLRKDVS